MEAILQDRIYENSIFGTRNAWGFAGADERGPGRWRERGSTRGEHPGTA